ncbi:MAG: HD domain-containing protein [Thermoanaerobacteraceae bacterium]|nr:HD domain-containing protein [Thermoanaerobacteraceae bacterium]
MRKKLSVNQGNLLLSMSEILDIANPSFAQHQQRTAFIAFEIAKYANLKQETIEDIFAAALLHDIGAISVEEKVALQNFESSNEYIHTIRGEMLIEQAPCLKKLSKIIRNHHRKWRDWDDDIKNSTVLASQIIFLSDYVERLIDRSRYILHQTNDIIEKVKKLEDTEINKEVVNYFVQISKREEFWLDLVSTKLYQLLLYSGPYRNREIGIDGILLISDLYRNVIDFKSRFTSTHTSGVSACAEKLAQLFGLTELETNLIKIAGNFHDIGKLAIPNSILEKPGKLTADEFAIIKCHTYYTYYILDSIGGLEQIARWAAYHHEKLDGSGYPFHCKAEEIDTSSRIMAVADIFTAIFEDRPYRQGMNKKDIYRIIKMQSDEGFIDRIIVDLLFDNYDSISEYVKEKQASAKDFYEKSFSNIL